MNAPRVIVVILAYGLWGTSKRSPKEIVGYGMYLNECANALRHLAECGYNVNVILCGGAIAANITEAQTMLEYFTPLAFTYGLVLHREDQGLTAPANIWRAYKRIEEFAPRPGSQEFRVLFICDWVRKAKVRWMVNMWRKWARKDEYESCQRSWSPKRSIISWPTPEIVAFYRPDISPKSNRFSQFMDLLAMKFIPGYLRKQINKLREE